MRPTSVENLFMMGGSLYTKNSISGKTLHHERIVKVKGVEYRYWNPYRSKMAALIIKRGAPLKIGTGYRVLYLGAANGTTASYISDLVPKGVVYCVEKSKIAYRDLLRVAIKRKNVVPILGDAQKPQQYFPLIGVTDMLYQDISQPNQAEIFIKNAVALKRGGLAVLMVKARSIDLAAKPKRIYRSVESTLARSGLDVLEVVNLSPYQRDHAAFIVRK